MSVDGFIPQIWTARLLAALQKALVFGQANVVNRDYEGEISAKGDTVNIGGIGAITVKAYTKNTDIDAPEDLSDDMTALVIDQAELGHSNPALTARVYAHVVPEAQRAALQALEPRRAAR